MGRGSYSEKNCNAILKNKKEKAKTEIYYRKIIVFHWVVFRIKTCNKFKVLSMMSDML